MPKFVRNAYDKLTTKVVASIFLLMVSEIFDTIFRVDKAGNKTKTEYFICYIHLMAFYVKLADSKRGGILVEKYKFPRLSRAFN